MRNFDKIKSELQNLNDKGTPFQVANVDSAAIQMETCFRTHQTIIQEFLNSDQILSRLLFENFFKTLRKRVLLPCC